MKEIPVEQAVGTVLVHDLTQIVPGQFKGPRFRKGHVVAEEDISVLLSMGKRTLYVVEKSDRDVHENEAAERIARAAAGSGIRLSEPSEGKIELFADRDGLLKINKKLLMELLEQDEIMFASIHENQLVKEGQKLAGTRVIPLFVNEAVMQTAEGTLKGISPIGSSSPKMRPLIEVKPLQQKRVGIVTTGSEIYRGVIEDKFGPILQQKFALLGSPIFRQLFADDDEQMIAGCIGQLLAEGAELIAVTGGMSVDPDDRTPAGIRAAGGSIVTYGAPVLPGAMFLLAYIGDVPVVGLPGCVMHVRTSIFELIVPRILAGERPTRAEIKALAHGGLCQSCETCRFPECGFGK